MLAGFSKTLLFLSILFCRYGNLELIEYLLSKGFKLESSTAYSLVHGQNFFLI